MAEADGPVQTGLVLAHVLLSDVAIAWCQTGMRCAQRRQHAGLALQ